MTALTDNTSALPTADADSLPSYWGPLPVVSDSTRAVPQPIGTPVWKHAVRVPYYVGTVPVKAVDWTMRNTVEGLDRLGVFGAAETIVAGLRDPWGNYWLPTAAYGDARGLEYGVVVQRPHVPTRGWVAKAGYTNSSKRSPTWFLGARSHLGERQWLEAGAGSTRAAEIKYYGIGLGTTEADESVYWRRNDWIGGSWRREWSGGLETTVLAHHTAVSSRRSRHDADEALALVHDGRIPFGYDQTSSGLTAGLELVYDGTDQRGRPGRGERLTLASQWFSDVDETDVRVFTWGGVLEKYFTLWRPQRTLAVKGWWIQQNRRGADPIPFTRLLQNRTPYKLRGYGSQRFHATGSTGVTAEYRWPIWIFNHPAHTGVDGFLFADVGQPFQRRSEVALAELLWSGGWGLRAVVGERADFALRLEMAWGDEGLQLRASAQQLFQFIKAGFYDGSDPLPVLR